MKGNPVAGIQYFFKGLTMLGRPELKTFVLGPFIVNVLLVGSLMFWGTSELNALLLRAEEMVPSWLTWLYWVIFPIVVLLLVVTVLYSFSFILNLLASPFNGLLSEKVEVLETNESIPEEGIMSLIFRTVGRELRKLMYFLPRFIFLFALSFFVPIFSPLLFLFGCWMFALQYLDYSLDNHGKDFQTLHEALKKEPLTALGFGLIVSVGFMIPVLNLLVMPAAVVGATLFWTERLRHQFIGH